MTDILASWELGLRYGHVALLNGVAQPLEAMGHRVTLAAKDLLTMAALPEGHFGRVLQAPVYLRHQPPKATITYGQVIADAGFADPAGLEALVIGWLGLFDLAKPDLVLAEHAPVSVLAAYVAGLPVVRIGTPFSVPQVSRPMPRLIPGAPTSTADAHAGDPDRDVDAAIDTVLRRLGRTPVGGLAGLLARSTGLLASWPELDFAGLRQGHAYYGPLVGLDGTARPDWPAGAGKRALVYLPFGHRAAPLLIDVLAERNWSVLWHSQERPRSPLPPAIRYAPEPIDVHSLLPEATIAISRAGHGFSAMTIRYGVPSLLFPDTLEAGLTASRMIGAALGVMPRRPERTSFEAALDLLTDDARIISACKASAIRYRSYDPHLAAERLAIEILARASMTKGGPAPVP